MIYDCYLIRRQRVPSTRLFAQFLTGRDSISSILTGALRHHIKLLRLHDSASWHQDQLISCRFSNFERTACNYAAVVARAERHIPNQNR